MTIKPQYIVNRQGKDHVLYAGLLALCHEITDGRMTIATEMLQAPTPENGHVAICTATVTFVDANGQVIRSCSGIGDASPENVPNRQMQVHLLRLSETRAKARAMRDATNVSEALVNDPDDDPREPHGGEVDTTHGKRAETAPRHTMADQEIGRQPEVRAAAQEPPRTVRQTYAAIYARAKKENLDAAELHTDKAATDAQMIEAGNALEAQLASIYGKPPAAPVSDPPATDTQRSTLSKLAQVLGKQEPSGALSRKAAADLITKWSEERYAGRRAVPR